MQKFKLLVITIIIIVGIFTYYLYYIDNHSINIKEVNLYNKKVDSTKHGLKILQFSDSHYSNDNTQKIKLLYKKVTLTKPDIIIFTGDLADNNLSTTNKKLLTNYLKKMSASTIKLAVLGEKDTLYDRQILINGNFTILNNELLPVYFQNNEPIYFYGTKHLINKNNFNPDFKNIKRENLFIFLTHNPQNTKLLLKYKPDYIFAGHNHNKEINFPFIDLEPSSLYPAFTYSFNTTKLYISNGLGHHQYKFRFNSQPRIELYRLLKNKKS